MSNKQLEILYSKYHDTIYINSGYSSNNKVHGSSRPYYIVNLQLFSQEIPFIAPTDLYPDNTFNNNPINICRNTTKFLSSNYPYIALYNNVWTSPLPGGVNCFWYVDALLNDPTTNIFSKAIPWNLDPNLGYNQTLQVSPINNNKLSPFDLENPWIFDGDAGYIKFLGSNYSLNPTFTFWRYEGNIGAQNVGNSGSYGVQGFIGKSGYDGKRGITGAQGATGSSLSGMNGAQGSRGTAGNTGEKGAQGQISLLITGAQGTKGSSGLTGVQGAQGLLGTDGNTGFPGLSNIKGSTGAQGFDGYGITGAQGLNGINYDGAIGANGVAGSTGTMIAGYDGMRGSTGSQGLQGYYLETMWLVVDANGAVPNSFPNNINTSSLGSWGVYNSTLKLCTFVFDKDKFPATKMPRYNGSVHIYQSNDGQYIVMSLPKAAQITSSTIYDQLSYINGAWTLVINLGNLSLSSNDNGDFRNISGVYFISLNIFIY